MGSNRTNEEIAVYTATIIQELEDYLHLLQRMDDEGNKRSDKIAQWIENWVKYLKIEQVFNPRSIQALKRGSIVYADFGFNVGREYGGLHYAIVLNKIDARSNHLLHVLPLTSVKETTDISNLKYFQLPIGNEVFQLLSNKALKKVRELSELYDRFSKKDGELREKVVMVESLIEDNKKTLEILKNLSSSDIDDSSIKQILTINKNIDFASDQAEKIRQEAKENAILLAELNEKLEYANKFILKTQNMNKDSIVLLNQVTTISKMRLRDPKNNNSILNGIVLSDDTMDKIDEALKNIF
ncbi:MULTISPECIES: type II toxin-antitoxin system PemK/MazF family toxin [Streptococcus]|jgi:mazF family toxin-antitoxin system|uniref:PemK-like protein n=1 Tax=Streptococcus infantis TaxID=68892 RepID=A0A0F3HRC3_9STRE|nr:MULTISPECIES: type II toxin-antitoxin system PemK/MazF family toxin [Streptococcus]KJU95498.1 PemK-like protein [Streptococcus infantis]OFK00702.1 growth inhibitor PemK [Streptococcus sp. HMSC071D03]